MRSHVHSLGIISLVTACGFVACAQIAGVDAYKPETSTSGGGGGNGGGGGSEVECIDAGPLVLADNFSRVAIDGWGEPPTGMPWQSNDLVPFSVAEDKGQAMVDGTDLTGVARATILSNVNVSALWLEVQTSWPPSGDGHNHSISFRVRHVDPMNYYALALRQQGGVVTAVIIEAIGGVSTDRTVQAIGPVDAEGYQLVFSMFNDAENTVQYIAYIQGLGSEEPTLVSGNVPATPDTPVAGGVAVGVVDSGTGAFRPAVDNLRVCGTSPP